MYASAILSATAIEQGRRKRYGARRFRCAFLSAFALAAGLFSSVLRLDVQIRLVEHLALVEFEKTDAFARLHHVFASRGVDLRLHFSTKILLLILHAFD